MRKFVYFPLLALVVAAIVTSAKVASTSQPPNGPPSARWTFLSPVSLAARYEADIACRGDAAIDNYPFSLEVTDSPEPTPRVVLQSVNGTSATTGLNWSQTVTEPQGGWTQNNTWKEIEIQLWVDNKQVEGDVIEVR
ncbi:MAG: hypothetical protein SFV81_07310 [Pirellulaceae bacterium]|nr:hypothetical protein [Pirellulaceae bacterium]